SALLSVFIAFLMAFAVNFTNMSPGLKRALSLLIMIPMLLPTITYGFTIIYSIGNQGLFTRLLNIDAPDFYGFKGLL
ncbi:iron ABC transporter permease, partial [Streptococcus anginosus]|nr:iron ABC transporter permease [Streptococcus anginosus]